MDEMLRCFAENGYAVVEGTAPVPPYRVITGQAPVIAAGLKHVP